MWKKLNVGFLKEQDKQASDKYNEEKETWK